jgi:hypothetical protein
MNLAAVRAAEGYTPGHNSIRMSICCGFFFLLGLRYESSSWTMLGAPFSRRWAHTQHALLCTVQSSVPKGAP